MGTPKQVQQFVAEVKGAFKQAVSPQSVKSRLELANQSIQLEFATKQSADTLLPAIRHLIQPQNAPCNLKICVWDAASTGVALPARPWGDDAFLTRRQIDGFDNDEALAINYDVGAGVFSYLDKRLGEAYWWVREVDQLPQYERAAPFRTILQLWFSAIGAQFVHAAAVGFEDGGVMLTGAGGSGKSTSALACLRHGMNFAGEDYCLLSQHERALTAHGVYSSAKLDDNSLKMLPIFSPLISNKTRKEYDKSVVYLYPSFAKQIAPKMPIKAFLVPVKSDTAETTWQPLKKSHVLRALAPTTIFQLAQAGHHSLKKMSSFVAAVPAFQLNIGRNLEQIPQAIQAILKEIA